jgi:hypothetical protein
MSDIPRDPTDDRDERLAARLETAPLDEVTRTRLVRTAMAASESDAPGRRDGWGQSSGRWLAVAAVIVLVVAVGFAVLARDDSASEPTAARSAGSPPPSSPLESTTDLSLGALDDSGAMYSIATGAASLGGLGEVGTKVQLRRAVRAAEAAAPASASKSSDDAARAAPLSVESRAAGCSPSLPGTAIAVGTGTSDGEPVTVYVVKRPDGSRAAVVVRADCDVGEPVPL